MGAQQGMVLLVQSAKQAKIPISTSIKVNRLLLTKLTL